jgi:AcrR family transcriptional regulator
MWILRVDTGAATEDQGGPLTEVDEVDGTFHLLRVTLTVMDSTGKGVTRVNEQCDGAERPGHGGPRGARRPSAARRRILETADRLFYDHGVRAISVDRLIAAAGVTRVTFYRHFPSKEDLVEAYLLARAERGRQRVAEARAQAPDDPRVALDAIADAVVEDSAVPGFRGCEFINAAAEYSDLTDRARALAVQQREWIVDVTEELLTRLGRPHPRELAEVLLMLRTGAVVAAGLDRSENTFPLFRRTWNALIDGTSDDREQCPDRERAARPTTARPQPARGSR